MLSSALSLLVEKISQINKKMLPVEQSLEQCEHSFYKAKQKRVVQRNTLTRLLSALTTQDL